MPHPILPLAASAVLALVLTAAEVRPVDGRSVRVIDGDTLQLGSGERIRLLGVDAPETRGAHCAAEARAAVAAKARLAALVAAGPLLIRRDGRDPYGRTLATLETPAGDAGALLVADGLALIWRPGAEARRKRIQHWCGGER